MKKIVFTIISGLLIAVGLEAQTVYDAAKFSDRDLNGTARFVGMGGAMGALGGDISTMGVNPAGIGLYRSSDIMTSFGFSSYGTESKYLGSKFENNWNRGSFDNIGFVFSTKIGNQTPLRYVNFGFNYHKAKSFYNNMSMEGEMGFAADGMPLTQIWQMADMANLASNVDYGIADAFYDAGWLPALGWQGHVMDQNDQNKYMPFRENSPYGTFHSRESGGIDQYDFNIAFNINDRVYFGLTLGAYDINYKKSITYSEGFGDQEGYLLQTDSKIFGSAFDIKFGTIIRPFAESSFRIGLAIHTPTFYKLTSESSALMQSDVWQKNGDKEELMAYDVDTYKILDNRLMTNEFKLRTPWTYNISLGYTVGKSLALGAEYEYKDYSAVKFSNSDGDSSPYSYENGYSNFLKGVSTFRIGAEYKVIPQFALRLGYNYTSDTFKKSAYKDIAPDAVDTDTDFSNKKAVNRYTIGLGYRGSMFYADLAYQFSSYKSDFYPFINPYETTSGNWVIATPETTKVTNTRSQVLLTLGMRF